MEFYSTSQSSTIAEMKERIELLEKENAELKTRLSNIHEMVATVALIPRQLMEFKGYIEELRTRDSAMTSAAQTAPKPRTPPVTQLPPEPRPRPVTPVPIVEEASRRGKVQLWDDVKIENKVYTVLMTKRHAPREFTNALMRALHSRKTLSSCSLTGKSSNAYLSCRPKPKLPDIEQTIDFIIHHTGASLKDVRHAICTLLNTETRSKNHPYPSAAKGAQRSARGLSSDQEPFSPAFNSASTTTVMSVLEDE